MKICGGYLAGSETDWLSQHIVFPEYFRQKFYETGNLWPDFAMELGGGQNIWNFAYYGLYNPLYLLSFLLPFVDMADYVQAVMLLTWISSGLLCYTWLKNGHFRQEDSFFGALLLILSGPTVYHTSMQIMFVSYMPFLLLTLMGYDRYVSRGKYGLLTAGTFLMVLTSFYFAVGGVAALLVYGLCGWKKEWASSPLVLIRSLWRQFYPAFFGGLLSFFYLVPMCLAMLGGRSEENSYSLTDLLLPEGNPLKLLYSPYGMGLTAMAAVVLCVSLFYRRCREKYMAACVCLLLLVPAASYILNGGLYIRAKAFIPLLPLVSYLAAAFFGYFRRGIIARKKLLAGYGLAALVLLLGSVQSGVPDRVKMLLGADLLLCALLFLAGVKLWRRAVCAGLAAVMACFACVQISFARESQVEAAWMEEFQDQDLADAARQVRSEDSGFYRMEVRGTREQEKAADNQVLTEGQNLTTLYSSVGNSAYETFREEILHLARPARNGLMQESTENPVFLQLMGVKYLLVREDDETQVPEGYEKTGQVGTVGIYENQDVAPIGYVTDQVISADTFEKLSWPEKSLALLTVAAAGDEDTASASCRTREAELASLAGDYEVTSEGETREIALEDRQEGDQYLFLSFQVKNKHPRRDVSVSVNGETNKQSASRGYAYDNQNQVFYFVCPLREGQSSVEITFGEGSYEISGVEAWYGSAGESPSQEEYSDAGLELTGDGDALTGSYTLEKDGWLITSIPFDEHFTVLVDGQEAEVSQVSGGFLGARAQAGSHRIEIRYDAPGKAAGLAVSLLAAVLLGADALRRRCGTGKRVKQVQNRL